MFISIGLSRNTTSMIFLAGPGHGAPGVLGPVLSRRNLLRNLSKKSQDVDGMRKFFKEFSFPGGIGSHCTPETPGSIHEGGELGYSVSHAFGAAFDNPDLIVAVVVGDGEAETGPLATSWHSNKFLNPIRDGAVLPILHLNGYKIDNPTLLARVSHEELENLLRGLWVDALFRRGRDVELMHQEMAATSRDCVRRSAHSASRPQARHARPASLADDRPSFPKGLDRPKEVDGHYLKVSGGPTRCRLRETRSRPLEVAGELDAQLPAREHFRRDRPADPGV